MLLEMNLPENAKDYFFPMDPETKDQITKLRNEGKKLDEEKEKVMTKIRELHPLNGDAEHDKKFFANFHDLELEGLQLEEKSIMVFLEATRLWKQMLQGQEAAGKVPDVWAEIDHMIYKRERINQIERDIFLEQIDFWIKTGVWVTP